MFKINHLFIFKFIKYLLENTIFNSILIKIEKTECVVF